MVLDLPAEEGTYERGEFKVTVEYNLVKHAKQYSGLYSSNTFEEVEGEDDQVRVSYNHEFPRSELDELFESDEWELKEIPEDQPDYGAAIIIQRAE